MTCRKHKDDVKTGVESLPRDQRWGDPLTASVASGMKVARVRSWLEHGTWEPVASMRREKPKWKPHEGQSTDARHRGGWARSSEEVPVMGMERRGPITQLRREVNPAMGRNLTGKRDHRSGDKSRMRRESHVRFREGLGVKFPRATRLLLGLIGPREDAEKIKVQLGEYLRDHLKLELSPEKTLITHARAEPARFLGYEISTQSYPGRLGNGKIQLRIPPQVIEEKIARYSHEGKPVRRPELIYDSDFSIVGLYGQELRGYAQYYAYAKNRSWLNRLRWYMEISLLKTLAAKHKSTISRMARRFAGKAITENGVMKCLSVIIERKDKPPLYTKFGGISLKTRPFTVIEDLPTDQDRIITRNELIQRLMADECELCGSRDRVVGHHVRKLADLKVKGRKEIPTWKRVMISRRRKTLFVCHYCHTAIHAGRPTRTRGSLEAKLEDSRPLESRVL